MRLCILYPIVWFVRLIFFLRYRIEVTGLKDLSSQNVKRRPGGIVFLPNHPAEIDPVILEMVLFSRFKIRPLVIEHFYRLKGFRFFMDLVGALPLPTMDEKANKWRGKRVKKQFDQMVLALSQGDNFLVYPAGRLKHTSKELIGGASLTHQLLQACPTVNVALVRTTGLWGSRFSRALTGESPDFRRVFWESGWLLLKNGIFFAPRRKVKVEIELASQEFPYQGTRLEVNKYLEDWYNRVPDPLVRVSSCFWKEELPSLSVKASTEKIKDSFPIDPRISEEVRVYLSKLSLRSKEEIEPQMHLSHDLGLDSLDVAQVFVFLDEHYGIMRLVPGALHTVEDVLQAASGRKNQQEIFSEESDFHSFKWPKEKRRSPGVAEGVTVQEVFLNSVKRHGSSLASIDALSGPIRYVDLKLRSLLLSFYFRSLPGEKIGIMLPSSCAAFLTTLGVLLARKVPVMLNWTVGAKALNHSLTLAGVESVITSMQFLDRLEAEDLGLVEEKFHFLEEIRETFSVKDQWKAVWLRCKRVPALLKYLKLDSISSSDLAVLLFTSGTESLPKAVPLSHENLLSNQRAAFQAVPFSREDRFYSVLPPFHSFGFSMTGLYPLLTGLRVCYAPDPTDAQGMARDIGRWKPTVFICAPSFIRSLFHVEKEGQLASLKWIVSGAEKTPQELFDYVETQLPKATLLEGYGVTECSPVVTIDRVGKPHQGVGIPLPGVELLVISIETRQPVLVGQEGEICIAGPNVFKGYINQDKDPFFTLEGKCYYLSGDLGFLDQEGCLHISGRLKRFVKIGGEMIGLSGLEEELSRLAKEKNWVTQERPGPYLAMGVRSQESDKPQLVLFTTFPIAKEDVNAALKQSGFGRIVKIARIKMLEEIPLTGTGKTHYRYLDELPVEI